MNVQKNCYLLLVSKLFCVLSGILIGWSAGDTNWGCGQRLSTIRTHSNSNRNKDQMGGKGICLAEHRWAWHYFDLSSAAGVVQSRQGSFNSESAIDLAPDSEDGRHLCRFLTLLLLISVVFMSARQLSRSKHKAYAIRLLPSRSWGWSIPQLAKHYEVLSVPVAFTLIELLHCIPQPSDVWHKL